MKIDKRKVLRVAHARHRYYRLKNQTRPNSRPNSFANTLALTWGHAKIALSEFNETEYADLALLTAVS